MIFHHTRTRTFGFSDDDMTYFEAAICRCIKGEEVMVKGLQSIWQVVEYTCGSTGEGINTYTGVLQEISLALPETKKSLGIKILDTKRIDAIQVQFKRPDEEGGFVDKGMKAWLTDVVIDHTNECYSLYFDFKDFEGENEKYFKNVYTADADIGVSRPSCTAIDAGAYNRKLKIFFGDTKKPLQDNEDWAQELLKVVDCE